MKSGDMPADLFLPKTLLQHLQNLHISQKCLKKLMWPAKQVVVTCNINGSDIIKTPGSHSSKIKKIMKICKHTMSVQCIYVYMIIIAHRP